MPEPLVFDSRDCRYKDPFGAVPCGRAVTYRCRPLASDGFTHCAVVQRGEFGGWVRETELSPAGAEGDRDCFEGVVPAPAEPELVWYSFRLWREDGSGCFLDRTGYRGDGAEDPWQLTVYRESRTPAWFGQGVVYQIFPDRYCRLSVPDPSGLVGDRWVHSDWEETPQWYPDPDGEIRCRDFFGGSLAGIDAHLGDLEELGVTAIYLCPIFESASNHRYDTADYTKIDPLLGTEEDFRALCAHARERGIRVILDGVFNHTGSRSVYFNADGSYPTLGAFQSLESPWAEWYSFHPWPTDYDAWWGIGTLPAVREECPSYLDFIIRDEDSVVRRWLRAGASGWRLDVADELPDSFIRQLRTALDETDPDALLLGEVWEDASNKISYSQRRRYLLGDELHGVMDYPFRTAVLDYLRGGDASAFYETMETLREHYPPDAFFSAMNFLGTHDTPRILTVLGAEQVPETMEGKARFRLSPQERERGAARVRLASLILFTFPGAPTVYYGDEAGLEGFEDPLNRGTYPWGHEDRSLRAWFARLGDLRRRYAPLRRGAFRWLLAEGAVLAFERTEGAQRICTVVNAGEGPAAVRLPGLEGRAEDLLSGGQIACSGGTLELPGHGGALLLTERST